MVNPVTCDNLRRGIEALYTYHEGKNAPARGRWVFHNDLYRELERRRRLGLDEQFWAYLVDQLSAWRAIRPQLKETIRRSGLPQLPRLRQCFTELAGDGSPPLPTLATLDWEKVAPLFKTAQGIKGASPPTFGAKLCHFLVPSAYFVWDNTLVKAGGQNYETYWEALAGEWQILDDADREAVKCLLREEILHAGSTPCETYPWATKITELCQFVPATG
jgi:hypothetical protein